MTLRTRLLLHYGALVALLAAGAASAAAGFARLGPGIERVLADNLASVEAAVDMLAALERQDRATLALLLDPGAGRAELDQADEAFAAALTRARGNLTVNGEEAVVARIEASCAAYRQSRQGLLAEPTARPLEAYQADTRHRFDAAKADAWALLALNQGEMYAADRRAQETAGWFGLLLGALVIVAVLWALWIARELRHHLFEPLARLREVAEAVGRGEGARRAQVTGSDEMARVAALLNGALDSVEAVEAGMRGRLTATRQVLLGLLARSDGPRALFGLDGSVIASTATDEAGTAVEEASRWIRTRGREVLAAFSPGADLPARVHDAATPALRLTLLVAEGKRPVGWVGETAGP